LTAMKSKKIFSQFFFICLAAISQSSIAKNILCVSETTETTSSYYYNGIGSYMYLLERYCSPIQILGDDFTITQTGWQNAKQHLDNCVNYDAVILWETPCYIRDQRGNDPYHSDIDVIPDSTAKRLTDYVNKGGALIVAGGVVNYGNGHPLIGSGMESPGKRTYTGYAKSPLADILPLVIEEEITISFFDNRKITQVKTSLLEDIELKNWPVNAYHKTKAKKTAQILAATDANDPIISRWQRGKGRVVAVTASPRANLLVTDESKALNPVWVQEAVLWDRILRWAIDIPQLSQKKEMDLIAKYENSLVSPEPQSLKTRLDEYPYIAHILDAAIPYNMRSLSYKYFNDLNFNRVVMQGFHSIGNLDYQHTPDSLRQWCQQHNEALAKNNLCMLLRASMTEAVKFAVPDANLWAQKVLPSGKLAKHYDAYNPCPYNKLVQKYAKEQMKTYMPIIAPFERIIGIVPEDEWAWVLGYRNPYEGNQGIGCYSPWANERFKKLTGQDAPQPVYRDEGYVASEDDLWLKWCQLIRQDAFTEYNNMVAETARKYRPDFLISNYPGGFEGNTDLMIEEVYLDCWRQSPLLAVERMDVRSNFRMDKLRTEIPLWAMIGIFRMPEDKSMYPETLRLTAGLTLGTGAKGIILWNSVNLWGQYLQHPGRAWLETEAKAIGEYLHKFGPMFLELQKEPANMWILSGWFWINSFDNYLHIPPADTNGYNTETPWRHIQISDIVAPATMRAGIYPEFVTEKQLLSEDLFKQKVVMLPGAIYSRQAVIDNLEKYIEKGGTVYLDESAKINIKGAEILPIDFSVWHNDIAAGKRPTTQPTEANYRKQRQQSEEYIQKAIPVIKEQLTAKLNPDVKINSTDSAYTMLTNGQTKYLFVYNTDEKNANSFEVECKNLPPIAYDIADSKIISKGKSPFRFDVSLPAGGWKVYALSPCTIDSVKINSAVISKNELKLSAVIYSEKNRIFSAAVPLKIVLHGKNGHSYELYRSANKGKIDIQIPLGLSISKLVKVTITEMFSNNKKTISIK